MNINRIIILNLLISLLYATSWHNNITHRPRIMFKSEDLNDIKSRLGSYPYNILWYNNYGDFSSIYTNSRKSVSPSQNTFQSPRTWTDERSKVSKDAAFVYAMNKRANGIDDLDNYTDMDNPWTRDQYKDHANHVFPLCVKASIVSCRAPQIFLSNQSISYQQTFSPFDKAVP